MVLGTTCQVEVEIASKRVIDIKAAVCDVSEYAFKPFAFHYVAPGARAHAGGGGPRLVNKLSRAPLLAPPPISSGHALLPLEQRSVRVKLA